MGKLKVLSLFSGLGAFERGLENLGIDFEVVGFSEWEPQIAKSYSMLHGIPEELNLGDVTKIDETSLGDFDLMTYGFPCTDVSIAKVGGKGLEGKASSMLYEALRIARHTKPKYMVAENVKNLVTKYEDGFKDMLSQLDAMGYNNYWKILDAKDFGVPQERFRVFVVSIRKDVDKGEFSFPTPRPHTSRTSSWWEFLDINSTRALTKRQQRMVDVAKGINKDDSIKFEGEIQFDRAVITLRQSGLRFQANAHHPTVTSYYGKGGGNFTILAHNGKVGGITPKQCLLLMGFTENDYDVLTKLGIPNSSIYIMAGNSIVVNVIQDIFANLFKRGVK